MKPLRAILIPLFVLGIELAILYLVFKFIGYNWGFLQNPYGSGDGLWLVFAISIYLMLRVIYAIRKLPEAWNPYVDELLLLVYFGIFVCPLLYGVWMAMDPLIRDYSATSIKDLVGLCSIVWPPVGLVLIHVGVIKLLSKNKKKKTKTAA